MTIDELKEIQYVLENVSHYDCVYENMIQDDVIIALKIINREINLKEMDPRKSSRDEIESEWPCGCKKTIDGVIIKCNMHLANDRK